MPDPLCVPSHAPVARCAGERAPTIDGVPIALPASGLDLDAFLDALGRALTEQALARSLGNIARAARLLGLKRTTLIERLKTWKRLGTPLEVPERKRQRAACR